jgi:tetratricopeptide (TPR) repeat protein
MLTWRHEQSRAVCEQALELARAVGARAAELRALVVLGTDLAYLGDGDQGLAVLREALALAEQDGASEDQIRAYTCVTDALTMLGRPRESARIAAEAVRAVERYGIEHSPLVSNLVEALVAIGEWDEADRVSEAALRANTANWPHHLLICRAEIETGRGRFDAARAHLADALASVGEDERGLVTYYAVAIELAVWEGRLDEAGDLARAGIARAAAGDAALIRVKLCALGLRARPAPELLTAAREAAAEAAAVTPNAGGWLALAEAECERGPSSWARAAEAWERLERPPLVAYCRWRQADALVASGADATAPLGEARAIAARIGARPLELALSGL